MSDLQFPENDWNPVGLQTLLVRMDDMNTFRDFFDFVLS